MTLRRMLEIAGGAIFKMLFCPIAAAVRMSFGRADEWLQHIPLGDLRHARLFGWWLIILNFTIVYRWYVRGKHHSWVPLVGGFVAFIGMSICPLPRIQKFAWVPLAVDCGYCVSVLAIGLLTACFATK